MIKELVPIVTVIFFFGNSCRIVKICSATAKVKFFCENFGICEDETVSGFAN